MVQRSFGGYVGGALGLALLLALWVAPAPAAANGTPIRVVLSYLTGVSNWGPENATGVAELVTSEGEVRMTANGLSRLNGDHYVLWLLTAGNQQAQALASFNATTDGVARVDLVLERAIPDADWSLVLVSVESDGAQPSQPSNRRSIAGRVTTPAPGQGGVRPSELPRTGGEAPPSAPGVPLSAQTVGVALAGVLVAGALGFGLGRYVGKGR